MTQTPQEHRPASTTSTSAPPVSRMQPIGPHARDFAAAHGDVADWSPERYELYAELGGLQ